MIIPFIKEDGSPNPAAMYANALMLAAIYHADRDCLETYALLTGGDLVGFDSDKQTFRPDRAVILYPSEALVFLDGTTNFPQWLAHAGSSFFPLQDEKVPLQGGGRPQAFGTSIVGLDMIESQLDAEIMPVGTGPVNIAGHSLGASAAFIYARRLKNANPPQSLVRLMTFGEPQTYDGRVPVREVDSHVRIIAIGPPPRFVFPRRFAVDPVVLMPPGQLSLMKLPIHFDVAYGLFSLSWKHWGTPWTLSGGELLQADLPSSYFWPFVNTIGILENLPTVALHLMDTSYLPKCRIQWEESGEYTELRSLDRFFNAYTGNPETFPDVTGPAVDAATINQGYFGRPDGPVTEPERDQWESISTTGEFFSPLSTFGVSTVPTLMKGTLIFNTAQGGFSESCYSTNPNDTLSSMMQKMQGLYPLRCQMSRMSAVDRIRNPVIPVGIRVEDELSNRDALTKTLDSIAPTTFPVAGGQADVYYQNLDLELGPRIKHISGAPQQTAFQVYHGMPISAFAVIDGFGVNNISGAFERYPPPNATWLAKLAQYVSYMCVQGLGFRSIAGAWNVNNAPGPYSAPDAVFYNSSLQMVELQWRAAGVSPNPPFFPIGVGIQAPANWPNLNSLCRLQVRGWKGFQVLNGRWAAQVVAPQTGNAFALRILRRCREPQTAQLPFVSPVAWVTWFPGQSLLPTNTVPVGNPPQPNQSAVALASTFTFIESKKLGKNADEERGRQRNRPT